MSAKEFLKENFVIVIGVTLPLLLVLFFVVARELPEARVPDPQYDLLFAKNYPNNSTTRLNFNVINGKLQVRYFPEQRNETGYVINRTVPELYYYDASKNSARKIPVELPVDENGQVSDKVQTIEVPMVADLTLEAGTTAPDGYKFAYNSRSHGGLMTEIMVGSHRRHRYTLEKDGRHVELPADMYYYNTHAIGWVIDGELKD